jgi:hypothetical protein
MSQASSVSKPQVSPIPLPPTARVIWRVRGETYVTLDPVTKDTLMYYKTEDGVFIVFARIEHRTGSFLFHDVNAEAEISSAVIDAATGRQVP